MTYYKVTAEGDNRPMRFGSTNIFVGGELITKGEVKRLNIDNDRLEKYTNKVKHSSHETYFCFGARFKKQLDAK